MKNLLGAATFHQSYAVGTDLILCYFTTNILIYN